MRDPSVEKVWSLGHGVVEYCTVMGCDKGSRVRVQKCWDARPSVTRFCLAVQLEEWCLFDLPRGAKNEVLVRFYRRNAGDARGFMAGNGGLLWRDAGIAVPLLGSRERTLH